MMHSNDFEAQVDGGADTVKLVPLQGRRMRESWKLRYAVAGVIVALASKVGFELDISAVAIIVSPIVAAILGQGMADFGKERSKLAD